MRHNDDSFATMLLMSQIDPGREELVRPLSTGEWHQLYARVRARGMSMGDLINLDMSGFMLRLGVTEQEAYRLCILLGRVLPLSVSMEGFAQDGIDILTWNQALYPARLRERLGEKAPPMLYLSGRAELFRQDAIAILGAKNARGEAEKMARTLARLAVENGYAVITDGAIGPARLAQDEAFQCGGRVIEVGAGGLSARVQEKDMLGLIELRMGAALSITHPHAPHTLPHARARNKCLYAMAHAAFILGVEKSRGALYDGALEALQRGWNDFIYVWDTPAYPDGRELLARGAGALRQVTPESFEQMARIWRGATARQLSMFDREDPLL